MRRMRTRLVEDYLYAPSPRAKIGEDYLYAPSPPRAEISRDACKLTHQTPLSRPESDLSEILSVVINSPLSPPPPMAAASKASTTVLHLLSALSVAAVYFLARDVYSWTLATHPAEALRLLLAVEAPVVIGVYSSIRRDPGSCSYWKAAGRGLVGLPVGALLNAFAAIVLGAPVGTKYLMTTLNWSLLMSLFTFVPAACVFGSSSMDWQRYIGHSKPIDSVDYMIFLPSYGAIIGAWLGAWPMPLDWEMPWQEWPICVTYGSVGGYLIGIFASLLFTLAIRKQDRVKKE